MSFASGYRGTVNGAVQTTYPDQPGVGIAGQIAFASDLNNIDAMFIGESNGIAAGKGVKPSAVSDDYSLQRPHDEVILPGSGDDVGDFAGILVFDESMQSDENGVPGLAHGRVGRIAKPGRAGARIYVKAVEAIDPATSTVNWVVVGGTDGLYEAGEFAPAALAGSAAAGYSTSLATVARWVTKAAAGGLAIIELF